MSKRNHTIDPNDPRIQEIMKKRAAYRKLHPRHLVGYQIHKNGNRVPVYYEEDVKVGKILAPGQLLEMRKALQLVA